MLLSVGCDIGVCVMNYDDMSDYKINRKIAWLIFGADKIIHRNPKSQSSILMHGMQGELDYCNNPSDAWSIIIDNKIGITHGSRMCSVVTVTENEFIKMPCTSEKILRAAMICFLKMKDAENETSN